MLLLGGALSATATPQQEPGQAGIPEARADYRVGPQDVLRITVFEEPDLSGRFKIDSDGTFTFPLIGRVTAGGSTLRAIEKELTELLADGYLINPQVSVEVEQYRSQNVYVLGEVRAPGVYPVTGNMNLIEVLVQAGSTTAAAGSEVQIVHPTGDRNGSGPVLPGDDENAEVTYVNLKDIGTGKLLQVTIRDGDTIYVPKAETFFVTGQVRNPGSFVWERGITVLQAISLAGGLTERGSNRGIRILRIVDEEQVEISVDLNDLVESGDTLRVRQRFF